MNDTRFSFAEYVLAMVTDSRIHCHPCVVLATAALVLGETVIIRSPGSRVGIKKERATVFKLRALKVNPSPGGLRTNRWYYDRPARKLCQR